MVNLEQVLVDTFTQLLHLHELIGGAARPTLQAGLECPCPIADIADLDPAVLREAFAQAVITDINILMHTVCGNGLGRFIAYGIGNTTERIQQAL